MRLDEATRFWNKRLAENQQILALIDSGAFTVDGKDVFDAETLAEMRQWATQRIAECVDRIVEQQLSPAMSGH